MKEIVANTKADITSLSNPTQKKPKASLKWAAWLSSRSEACKHRCEGCVHNSLNNSGSKFLYAYLTSNLLQVIPLILKPAKIIKQITSSEKIKDSCKFALFVTIFSFTYKAALCFIRRLVIWYNSKTSRQIEPDKVAAPLAGFIAGLSLAVDSAFRRQFIAVLAMSRFLETGLSLAEGKQAIPKVWQRNLWLWLLANLLTQYYLSCEKDLLNGSIKSFYTHWAQMKPNDKIQVEVWHRMKQDKSPFW